MEAADYLRSNGEGGSAVQRTAQGTDAVLAAALKELMNDDIIHRRQYDEIPPRVEYCLTEKGNCVVPILQSICRWSGAYHKEDCENALSQCQKCDYHAGF